MPKARKDESLADMIKRFKAEDNKKLKSAKHSQQAHRKRIRKISIQNSRNYLKELNADINKITGSKDKWVTLSKKQFDNNVKNMIVGSVRFAKDNANNPSPQNNQVNSNTIQNGNNIELTNENKKLKNRLNQIGKKLNMNKNVADMTDSEFDNFLDNHVIPL